MRKLGPFMGQLHISPRRCSDQPPIKSLEFFPARPREQRFGMHSQHAPTMCDGKLLLLPLQEVRRQQWPFPEVNLRVTSDADQFPLPCTFSRSDMNSRGMKGVDAGDSHGLEDWGCVPMRWCGREELPTLCVGSDGELLSSSCKNQRHSCPLLGATEIS